MDGQLAYSSRLGDASKTVAVINAVSSTLNIVECNTKSTCDGYNREPCSKVPMTCGECKSGYIGLAGHANKECAPMTTTSRRSLNTLGKTGDRCGDNTMCLSGSCVDNICEKLSKVCPNACNGAGKCVFVDAILARYWKTALPKTPFAMHAAIATKGLMGATYHLEMIAA